MTNIFVDGHHRMNSLCRLIFGGHLRDAFEREMERGSHEGERIGRPPYSRIALRNKNQYHFLVRRRMEIGRCLVRRGIPSYQLLRRYDV